MLNSELLGYGSLYGPTQIAILVSAGKGHLVWAQKIFGRRLSLMANLLCLVGVQRVLRGAESCGLRPAL